MTVAEQVKQFGAQVKKDGCAGYYIYEGRNFTVQFYLEECVTKYWAVDLYENDNEAIREQFWNYNQHETKKECVYSLLCLDQELEEAKNK